MRNIFINSSSLELKPWVTLIPAIILVAYFVIGLFVYLVRCLLFGQHRDSEFETRNRTVITFLGIRLYFAWIMRPIWNVVYRSGIPATAITTLSLFLAFVSAFALGMGRFALGGWLFLFSGICDFLDGRVARYRKETSESGKFLDSVMDRYSDGVVYIGLAWFYRETWVLAPVLVAMLGAQLISYVRAKGESMQIRLDIGLMQRPERVLILGSGLTFSPIVESVIEPGNIAPTHHIAIIAIVILAIGTQMTAAGRFIYGMKSLNSRASHRTPDVKRRNKAGRYRLISSVIVTFADFGLYIYLIEYRNWPPGLATIPGCLTGAIANYHINLRWVYKWLRPSLSSVRLKYLFVATSSSVINSVGVVVLLSVPGMNALLAWALVRMVVFVTWNYPLHKDYIYRRNTHGKSC